MRSLIVARTPGGAESAARLATGDSLSIVADPLDDASSELIATSGADRFIIECDARQRHWLGAVMESVAQVAGPTSQILLLFAPGSEERIEEALVVDSLTGWVIDGATVLGDVVVLHADRTTEDVDATTTIESLRGAQQLASMLRFVAHPSDDDLPEFEYESSLATSYLAQVPRLKSDIRALQRQVADAERKSQRRATGGPRPGSNGGGRLNDGADTSKDRRYAHDEQQSSRSRRREFGIVALLAILTIVALWAVTVWLDAGVVGSLAVIAVAAVGALAMDIRRRFIGLNRWVRQNAANLQRQLQLQQSISKKVDGVTKAVDGATKAMATSAEVQRVSEATSAEVRRVSEATSAEVRRASDAIAASVAASAVTAKAHHERAERQAEATLAGLSDAAGRLDRLATSSDAGFNSLRGSLATKGDIARLMRAELLITYNQIESNIRLRDIVEVTGMTPPMRGWAASPDVIAFLVSELRHDRPRLVVECGSGASTVWLAMAVRSMGLDTRIVALEHDPRFGDATSQILRECGVDEIAEVRLAPLSEITLGDFTGYWYAPSALEGLEDIGLVFVDGPPASIGELSRYPALPMMSSKLAARATVVLDDLVRDEEKRIVERWKAEFPDAVETTVSVEKGAAVLRFSNGG